MILPPLFFAMCLAAAWLAMKTSCELLADSPLLPQPHLTLTFTRPKPKCSVHFLGFVNSVQCLSNADAVSPTASVSFLEENEHSL